jgi:hypothetical protein
MAKTSISKHAAVPAEPPEPPQQVTLIEDEIARLAYELYLSRGREDGRDVEDWLRAKHQLRTRLTSTRA